MLYGLDPDYDKNLEENKFLKEFKFVDDDLRFINKGGHLVDIDGKLVDEDGRFIAYRTEEGMANKDPEQVYFINRDGEEVVAIKNDKGEEEWVKISLKERKPFLDEDDNPIECEAKEEPAEASPKKKRKTTKTTT
jgi:hypothetical protein